MHQLCHWCFAHPTNFNSKIMPIQRNPFYCCLVASALLSTTWSAEAVDLHLVDKMRAQHSEVSAALRKDSQNIFRIRGHVESMLSYIQRYKPLIQQASKKGDNQARDLYLALDSAEDTCGRFAINLRKITNYDSSDMLASILAGAITGEIRANAERCLNDWSTVSNETII